MSQPVKEAAKQPAGSLVPLDKVAEQLNMSVQRVIGSDTLQGFEKAYQIATATEDLKLLLSTQIMTPIMNLQGNKLGFKTDKDNTGGYPMEVVKNCLIEAVLTGVQPFGNQFNIIAGNCYITKEGFGYLLSKIPGLSYEIIPELPRIANNSAAVAMNIEYTYNNVSKSKKIDFAIKVNQFMGADAVIGKATRKARAWLYNTITGSEVADGDAQDAVVVSSKIEEDPQVTHDDLQFLYDAKKAALTEQERKSAERILTEKEENSYLKLYKYLKSK